MNKLLQKKSIQLCLAVILVLVWGYNMFKIADISNETGAKTADNEITFDSAFFTMPEVQKYEYEGNFSDPFKPQLHPKRQEKKPEKKSKSPPKPDPVQLPNLKLSGVIEGTALIQNREQVIFFAAVGDTVESARVQSISADSVVMKIKSKEFTIRLQ